MKFKTIIVSLLLIVLLSVNASALSISEHSLEFDAGEEYTLLTEDNLKKNSEFVTEILNHSVDSMKAFFKSNSVLFFAADDNNTKQIKLTFNQTDFSKQIGSLRNLSDNDLNRIANQILGSEVKWHLVEKNNMKMYCVASKGSDSGGEYCTIQFFTIINGGIYNLSYHESSSDVDKVYNTALDIADNLKITDKSAATSAKDVGNDVLIVLIALIILAALAVVIYIIVTFVIDIKNKQNQTDDEESVIRRRRF